MPTKTIQITLPRPLPWQSDVAAHAARFNVLAVGRRAGKTTFGIDRSVAPDVLALPVGWFSPTYKDMLEVWRELSMRVAGIASRVNASERRIEYLTGGLIEFWSLDNPNASRGRKYKRVVIDEAAFVPNLLDAWNYAIRPTLADYQGDAWILSTPKGHNGFWQMYGWGQDTDQPDWRSWQLSSSVNPRINQSELDEMQRNLPERVYQQEILAHFIDDAGGVFRHVVACATAAPLERGEQDGQYIMGLDWGKSGDWTAITVLDGKSRAMVALDRFNQIDYQVQFDRVRAMCDRFKPAAIIAETNSIGQPNIEQLIRMGLPVQGFTTTNASKSAIIDSLAAAFERKEISIVPDPVLVGELQAYEQERLPVSGLWRYSAPAGMHDDCVMSLAMAWYGVSQPKPNSLFAFI